MIIIIIIIIWNVGIQMDHPIQARRLDPISVNTKKRTCFLTDLALSANHRIIIKESEQLNKYLNVVIVLKNMKSKGDSDTNHSWVPRNNPNEPKKRDYAN